MKHKLLKNILLGFLITCLTIFCCGHFACTQKAFLYLLLRTQFKTIEFKGYKGNWLHVSAESISLKDKKQSLCLRNLDLSWEPLKLLTQRCFFIQKMNLFLELNSQVSSMKKEICTADFSKIFSQNASKFSFLKQLQLPIPLNIQHLNVAVSGHVNGLQLINTRLFIENFVPNMSGVCNYTSFIETDNQPYFSHLQVQGSAQMLLNKKNEIQKLKVEGFVNAKHHQKKYPKCTYTCFIAGSEHSKSETLKCEVHWGQANDFSLEGETFKTADHALNLRWQGIFDHTLIHTFYPHPTPNLSVLLDGTCNLNRKTNRWDTHTLVSVWGKQFETIDASLKNLPNLNFKAELQACFDAKEIQVKNYKISLKEKGAKKLFFSVRSDQALTYHLKKGLQTPVDRNLQLLDLHIYEIPLAFINPYLQNFDLGIEGQLQSGNFGLTYTDQEKWQLSVLQPLRIAIKKLTYKKTPILSNTHLKLDGKTECNSEMTKINYEGNLMGADTAFTPFFILKSYGNWVQKEKELKTFASNGVVKFNQILAQGKLDLSALNLQLHPDLVAQFSYDLKKEKQDWAIKQLKASLQSHQTGNTWLYFNLNQPLCLKTQDGLKSLTDLQGNIVTFQCEQCPLDLVRYKGIELTGKLSMLSQLSCEKNILTWEHQAPICIDNLQVSYQGQKALDLKTLSANLQCSLDHKAHACYGINDLTITDTQTPSPLLKGSAQICFKKDKLEKSQGRLEGTIDGWFLQPFALKFPGLVGDLSAHWSFHEKERSANAQCKLASLNNDLSFKIQGAYQNEKDDQHSLQSNLEISTNQHTSDLHFEGNLKKTLLDGKITSKQLFLTDAFNVQTFLQSLDVSQFKSAQHQVIATAKTHPKMTASHKPIKTSKDASTQAPWYPYTGTMVLNCKSIWAEDEIIKDLTGQLEITPSDIKLKDGKGFFFGGNTQFNLNHQFPASFKVALKAQDMHLLSIWNTPKAFGINLNKYGNLHGNCNLNVDWSGDCTSLLDSKGGVHLKVSDGHFKPFSPVSAASQVVSGLTSTLSMLVGSSIAEMSSLGFLNTYLKSVPISSLKLDLERKNSDKIDLKASIQNTDAAFYANGFVRTEASKTWQQQAFKFNVQLDASDGPFLNYFAFDTTQKTNEGYYPGPSCEIDGTLGKPNYMNLLQLLNTKPQSTKKISPRSSIQQLLRQFL